MGTAYLGALLGGYTEIITQSTIYSLNKGFSGFVVQAYLFDIILVSCCFLHSVLCDFQCKVYNNKNARSIISLLCAIKENIYENI